MAPLPSTPVRGGMATSSLFPRQSRGDACEAESPAHDGKEARIRAAAFVRRYHRPPVSPFSVFMSLSNVRKKVDVSQRESVRFLRANSPLSPQFRGGWQEAAKNRALPARVRVSWVSSAVTRGPSGSRTWVLESSGPCFADVQGLKGSACSRSR